MQGEGCGLCPKSLSILCPFFGTTSRSWACCRTEKMPFLGHLPRGTRGACTGQWARKQVSLRAHPQGPPPGRNNPLDTTPEVILPWLVGRPGLCPQGLGQPPGAENPPLLSPLGSLCLKPFCGVSIIVPFQWLTLGDGYECGLRAKYSAPLPPSESSLPLSVPSFLTEVWGKLLVLRNKWNKCLWSTSIAGSY